jgi:RNA polymerase sigma-70 factor (family 1)
MQLSEPQLMAGFKAGNPDCFRYIFDCHHGPLFYFVIKLLNDKEVAEEITSEVYVKLWQLRADFSKLQNIKAFLFISARNASLDYLRKQRTDNNRKDGYTQYITSLDDSSVQHDLIETEVVKHYLHEEISKLPTQCQKIVRMAYFEKLKNSDIAIRLQLSMRTVKNQKNRGINKLRVAMSARLERHY